MTLPSFGKDVMDKIRNNIRDYLEKMNMSQRKLAELCDTTEVSISRYVAGERVPTAPMCIKIAKALHCAVEDLYTVEEDFRKADVRNDVAVLQKCMEIMSEFSMREILQIISFLSNNVSTQGDVFPIQFNDNENDL